MSRVTTLILIVGGLAACGTPATSADTPLSVADLDLVPAAIHQPAPVVDEALQGATPATVHVSFVVDERGRVVEAHVDSSTDSAFDPVAIAAVRQWTFQPGLHDGKPVPFRMRVPISFPKA